MSDEVVERLKELEKAVADLQTRMLLVQTLANNALALAGVCADLFFEKGSRRQMEESKEKADRAAIMGSLASMRLTELMAEAVGEPLGQEAQEVLQSIKEEARRRGYGPKQQEGDDQPGG